ncbi:hypothetical protein JL722_11502 [Aureococcus anophagefferens]|nr:hypothetical protein JL722_11502 [Aureococcus anophagefferens]
MWRVVVAASLAAASLAAASPAASPNATRRERVALAALVVSGHKAADEGFVQQSACAALALFASARAGGRRRRGASRAAAPRAHDPATWRSAPPGWRAAHGALVARLAALVGDARDRASVRDLVPWLLDGAYPFLRRNLNYMKLAAYRLEGYDAVLFLDLDVVVTAPLAPLLALSRGAALVGDRADVDRRFGTSRPHFDVLELGHIDVDSADVGTNRSLSSSRSSREPFASAGFDGVGDAGGALRRLWDGGAFDPPGAPPPVPRSCAKVTGRASRTWDLAGAGTGQGQGRTRVIQRRFNGLMWYYYGLTLGSYASLTYAALPLVHYNAPGPKPWAAHAEAASADVAERQHCDFAWWAGFAAAAAAGPAARFGHCAALLGPHLAKKRAARHFAAPACCRRCPGGGHFATAQPCASAAGLPAYATDACVVAAELEDAAALAL